MKIFSLESKKAFSPATYKQIKFAEKLADKTNSKLPSTSQLMKYCEMETISEAIDAMLAGEQIEIC
jgi:hypothetical protein